MSKIEELINNNERLNGLMNNAKVMELLKKEEPKKKPNIAVIIFAIIGVVVAVAAAAYGIYRFLTPDYLDDFEDDLDDDYEDDFFEDDEVEAPASKKENAEEE